MPDVHDAPNTVDGGEKWQMASRFILRSTGFPFDLLESLRLTRSNALATSVVQAEKRVTQFQAAFAHEIFPQLCDEETLAGRDRETFRMWYAIAKKIRQGRGVDAAHITWIQEQHDRPELVTWLHVWNDALEEAARLRAEGEACFTEEFVTLRTRLREIVAAPRFQEALWLSNPGVYETGWHYYCRHWDANERPSKIKHLERRFYTYLQRFCAKNDTTSFFGPLNYGTCGEQESTSYHRTAELIRDRRVFLAYWAVEALAKHIASDPATHPYLVPRRHPARRRPPEEHDSRETIVYRCADGERSVLDIAHSLHLPLEEILSIVEALVTQGWLSLAITLPPAALSPLDVLLTCVRSWPDISLRQQWLATLEELKGFCDRFAWANLQERQAILASIEERFVAIVGSAPRRGQGKMFQDRSLLYEECAGNIAHFHLSREHSQCVVEALTPIARLCAAFSNAWWSDLHAAALSLFDALSPDGEALPFTTFVNAWRAKFPTPPSARANALQSKLFDLVLPHQNEHVCRLTESDLAPLYTEPRYHLVFSPDILLAAADSSALAAGQFRVVLGEIHHGIQPVGWMLLFADDPETWQKTIMQCLPQPTAHIMPANLLLGRRMKTAPPEFPGPSIQASAFSERPHQPDLRDLFLERHNGQLCLRQEGEQRCLMFYPPSYGVPDALYAPFAAFSYPFVRQIPVRLEGHTPRVEIGNAIYQRERWDMATALVPGHPDQKTTLDLLTAFVAFRERFGLPERVFVRTPAEAKPVYIDFQNALALEMLVHLASQSDSITFVEMCPDPDELWLHDGDGRYCSELRTVLSLKTECPPEALIYRDALSLKGESA